METAIDIPVIPAKIKSHSGVTYSFHRLVGKGGYARCFLVKAHTPDGGMLYAAKTTTKISLQTEEQRRRVYREVRILHRIHHPNIVRLIDYCEDNHNIYVVIDFCPNASLSALLARQKNKGIRQDQTWHFFVAILHAVQFLHGKLIHHGDLKLNNILLDRGMQPIICDFGFASALASSTSLRTRRCGTPTYMAPEILQSPCRFGLQADIWSMGVMLYTMLYGCTPFEASDTQKVYERIRRHKLTFPERSPDISPGAINLIHRILDPILWTRLSLQGIAKHGWIAKGPPQHNPNGHSSSWIWNPKIPSSFYLFGAPGLRPSTIPVAGGRASHGKP